MTKRERRGGAGVHLQPAVLVRLSPFALDLVNEAAAKADSGPRAEWLRSSLVLQAAEELGLDPNAALGGRRALAGT